MRTLEPILAEHPFFRALNPKYLQLLVGCASNAVFQPESFLFRSGDASNAFYVIREGEVAIELTRGSGGSALRIQTAGAGDVLGWSWLIDPHTWRFDGRALVLTRAIALDGTCLRQKCEADHDLGYEMLKRFSRMLAQRLEATRVQLLDIYGAPTP